MASKLQVYRCEVCGHIIEVLHSGAGTLTCCDQPMKQLKENMTDAAKEKHVPVVEKTATGYKVKVGSVAHPMLPEHYIEWIELLAEGAESKVYRQFLSPGQAPEAEFQVSAAEVSAREYCNLHGLWKR